MNKEQILIITREDLETLLHELMERIDTSNGDDNPWILPSQAMQILGITSKSHFWKLKSEGCFEISTPSRKVQLVNKTSLLAYIDKFKKPAF